jgi:hypothetical protein
MILGNALVFELCTVYYSADKVASTIHAEPETAWICSTKLKDLRIFTICSPIEWRTSKNQWAKIYTKVEEALQTTGNALHTYSRYNSSFFGQFRPDIDSFGILDEDTSTYITMVPSAASLKEIYRLVWFSTHVSLHWAMGTVPVPLIQQVRYYPVRTVPASYCIHCAGMYNNQNFAFWIILHVNFLI